MFWETSDCWLAPSYNNIRKTLAYKSQKKQFFYIEILKKFNLYNNKGFLLYRNGAFIIFFLMRSSVHLNQNYFEFCLSNLTLVFEALPVVPV